jgi:hypothetical protein
VSYAPITARGGGKDFELVPEGTHFAICNQVVYLGIQAKTYNDGAKELPEVYFRFEIPDVQIEYTKKGKQMKGPATIGRTFTLSIGKTSNLGPFLINWRGKQFTQEEVDNGFDINSLLGKVCNLGVVHSEDGKYANISSAGKLLKIQNDAIEAGTLKVEPFNPLVSFNADSPDPAIYEALPKFLKKKIDARITTTKTGKPLASQATSMAGYAAAGNGEEFDDEIPF